MNNNFRGSDNSSPLKSYHSPAISKNGSIKNLNSPLASHKDFVERIAHYRHLKNERDRSLQRARNNHEHYRVNEVENKIKKRIHQIRKQRIQFEEIKQNHIVKKEETINLNDEINKIIEKKRQNAIME